MKIFVKVIFLKVLPSEMDPAEIRLIRYEFIKEKGTEVFGKIWPSPILWEPFKKIPRHLVQ